MQRYGRDSDIKDIIDKLDAQGWNIDRRSATKFLCKPPGGGEIVTVQANSGDRRALANIKSMLRKGGAQI